MSSFRCSRQRVIIQENSKNFLIEPEITLERPKVASSDVFALRFYLRLGDRLRPVGAYPNLEPTTPPPISHSFNLTAQVK